MPKYEYHPVGFQPIPTPEEEAREELRMKGNKSSNQGMIALAIMIGIAIFHDEIGAAAVAIWRLFV